MKMQHDPHGIILWSFSLKFEADRYSLSLYGLAWAGILLLGYYFSFSSLKKKGHTALEQHLFFFGELSL